MSLKLTPEEAKDFKERWRLANERIDQELLNTPPEVKLKQLEALFQAVADFGWTRSTEDDQTWRRWKIIREFYAG
ncbi:MAG: hypothetical protein IPM66_03030 [Acidobacteriota bacterium]|nr:MAG: hypothetical protein IPM66_03030 [Acidobacteriota bacterium]